MKATQIGNFEETILLLVGILDHDAYAFRIAEEFESQAGRKVSIGAVHSTLSRLTKKGLLTSEMTGATNERGGRRKRVYTITASGKHVLIQSKEFKLSLWNQLPAFGH